MSAFPMFAEATILNLLAECEAKGLVKAGLAIEVHEVGSRITCDPAPTDTDQDFLVKVEKLEPFVTWADDHDWGIGGSAFEEDDAGHEWASLRKGNVNLLVSADEDFIARFLAAHTVAKRFNLLLKSDRVALFQAVMYARACEHIERPLQLTEIHFF